MDYEKKYKEALKVAQKLYQDCPNGKNDRLYHTTDLEKMFPELKVKESEDERIRKELIEHVKDQQSSFISAPDCRDKYEEEENNKYNSWLAWLEKQGKKESNKMSVWKHWKDGICGNGEGKPIYLIKNGDTYSISSCLGYECDYIELSELDKLISDKRY